MKLILPRTVLATILLLALHSCNSGAETKFKKKASVVFPVTIDAFEELKKGLKDACGDSIEISFFSAEGDASKFETAIQNGLINKPEYLVTIGTQITNTAFAPKFKNNLNIVIAGAISTPDEVDALRNIGLMPKRSKPVSIIKDSPIEDIYELFGNTVKSVLPNLIKAGIIYNASEINSKSTAKNISLNLSKRGIAVVESTINSPEDIEKNVDKLIHSGVEAVIIPHDKIAVTKAASIVKKCNAVKIPVFSLDDGTVRKDGVSIGISVNYYLIGKLIGESMLAINNGSIKAEDMPIKSLNKAGIYLNTATLDLLGLKVPKDVIDVAIKY